MTRCLVGPRRRARNGSVGCLLFEVTVFMRQTSSDRDRVEQEIACVVFSFYFVLGILAPSCAAFSQNCRKPIVGRHRRVVLNPAALLHTARSTSKS